MGGVSRVVCAGASERRTTQLERSAGVRWPRDPSDMTELGLVPKSRKQTVVISDRK